MSDVEHEELVETPTDEAAPAPDELVAEEEQPEPEATEATEEELAEPDAPPEPEPAQATEPEPKAETPDIAALIKQAVAEAMAAQSKQSTPEPAAAAPHQDFDAREKQIEDQLKKLEEEFDYQGPVKQEEIREQIRGLLRQKSTIATERQQHEQQAKIREMQTRAQQQRQQAIPWLESKYQTYPARTYYAAAMHSAEYSEAIRSGDQAKADAAVLAYMEDAGVIVPPKPGAKVRRTTSVGVSPSATTKPDPAPKKTSNRKDLEAKYLSAGGDPSLLDKFTDEELEEY